MVRPAGLAPPPVRRRASKSQEKQIVKVSSQSCSEEKRRDIEEDLTVAWLYTFIQITAAVPHNGEGGGLLLGM